MIILRGNGSAQRIFIAFSILFHKFRIVDHRTCGGDGI
jgi:hypothetical protein